MVGGEGYGGVTNLLKSDHCPPPLPPDQHLAATIQAAWGELPDLKASPVFPIQLNRNSLDRFFDRFRLSLSLSLSLTGGAWPGALPTQ